MADEVIVKANATITLSCERDIQSVTRYYKLQSSTAAAPSKPTTNPPPSGWDDTEPSYTSGSTNTLYFCDLTVFSTGSPNFSYSEVSKSSSYEAAKEAYGKAVNAENNAKAAQSLAESADMKLASWCAENDKTLIDGGKVYMDQAFANKVFAYDITAEGSISGASLYGTYIEALEGKIGGFSIDSSGLYSELSGGATFDWTKTPRPGIKDVYDDVYARFSTWMAIDSLESVTINAKYETLELSNIPTLAGADSGSYTSTISNITKLRLKLVPLYSITGDGTIDSNDSGYLFSTTDSTKTAFLLATQSGYRYVAFAIGVQAYGLRKLSNGSNIGTDWHTVKWFSNNYSNYDYTGTAIETTWQPIVTINRESANVSITPFELKYGDFSIGSSGLPTFGGVGLSLENHNHDTAYVPLTRTINGKALSSNISLTYSDVGAAASGHTHARLYNGDFNVVLGVEGSYGYFRPPAASKYFNGSSGYPWYDTYTERLHVTAERIVCKPTVDTTTTYAANVYVGTTGIFTKYKASTSSKYIKHDIKELQDEAINAERLYDVDVVQFKYNEGELPDDDQRYLKDLPGFIIENMAEVYPIAVDKQTEDSKGWSWNDHYIIPPMLKLIQNQHKEIEAIKTELKEIRKE